MHVDHHELWIHPSSARTSCGGATTAASIASTNGGTGSWTFMPGLPITQFYACTAMRRPRRGVRRHAGQRHEAHAHAGPRHDWEEHLRRRRLLHARRSDELERDLRRVAVRRPGEVHERRRQFLQRHVAASAASDRKNWSHPVVMDPSSPQALYYGDAPVCRSTNSAASLERASPDLSDGAPGTNASVRHDHHDRRRALQSARDLRGHRRRNVWVTTNGGDNWTKIDGDAARAMGHARRGAIRPTRRSPTRRFPGYREDDPLAHVFRTTDLGATWTDISRRSSRRSRVTPSSSIPSRHRGSSWRPMSGCS